MNGKEGTMAKLDIIDRSGKTADQMDLPAGIDVEIQAYGAGE